MSVSSAIKDGKYCKANVTHVKMDGGNGSDNTRLLQLYLDGGKAREIKRKRQSVPEDSLGEIFLLLSAVLFHF